LVEEVFKTCLFDIIERENSFQDLIDDQDANVFGKDYVKAKSKESRAAAYKLLSTLCKDSPANTSIMLENLNQLMKVIMKLNTNTGWGYSPASDTKSFYGYVGLRNLGCICYMNAML
jgi:ubiquitin carboxyl-terminal hydrolase 9/24